VWRRKKTGGRCFLRRGPRRGEKVVGEGTQVLRRGTTGWPKRRRKVRKLKRLGGRKAKKEQRSIMIEASLVEK